MRLGRFRVRVTMVITMVIGKPLVRTIKASEFKAKCLQLMDEVAQTGEGIVITKYGKPLTRLEAFRSRPDSLFGILQGSVEILGDIVAPVGTDWEADR